VGQRIAAGLALAVTVVGLTTASATAHLGVPNSAYWTKKHAKTVLHTYGVRARVCWSDGGSWTCDKEKWWPAMNESGFSCRGRGSYIVSYVNSVPVRRYKHWLCDGSNYHDEFISSVTFEVCVHGLDRVHYRLTYYGC
jgi:hypothetical protein